MSLPTDAKERKGVPLYSGVLKYFPDALAYVAKVSKYGNDQHNPGQPLHWSRGKSDDHHDCASRHLVESGTIDSDGLRHSGKLAWRTLAILQLELETDGIGIKKSEYEPIVNGVAGCTGLCTFHSPVVCGDNRYCSVCLKSLPEAKQQFDPNGQPA